MEVMRCDECGVPEQITRGILWLNSGVLVQSSDPSRRIGFIECENLDPVYADIGEIIGVPIDRLVVDVARKGTISYMRNITSPVIRKMIKEGDLSVDVIIEALTLTASLNGFGRHEFIDVRFEGDANDFIRLRVTEPFSVLLVAGAVAGSAEAVTDNPNEVMYSEVSKGVYEIKGFVSEHAEELKDRLVIREYHDREGDIDLERCPTCGGPKALSGFKWAMNLGVIMNSWTDRRMAMIGPEVQDPVFQELERELGDTIPPAIIEAQRRFVTSAAYSEAELGNEGDLRTQLAVRGLGMLREIKMARKCLLMRIDNAADHLMTIGMAQGLFELAFGTDSYVEWEISPDDDLALEVTPSNIITTLTA